MKSRNVWFFVLCSTLFPGIGLAQSGPTIHIRVVGDAIETSWTDSSAVLQEADSAGGPWNYVLDAASPYVSQPTGGARFFRVVHGAGGDVVGSLYTSGAIGGVQAQMATPGISVRLVNLATQAEGSPVTTDANGVYILARQPPGHYQLCWQAPGFVSACSTQHIAIVDDIVYLAPEAIALQNNGTNHALFGQLSFLDGSAFSRHDAFFGISFDTTVSLGTSGGPPLAAASPNSSGQFVLTGVPLTGAGLLTVTCESLVVHSDVGLAQTDAGTIMLPNHQPQIERVIATFNGEEIKRAAPGATVTLTASAVDEDGDGLHYFWQPSLSQGSFVSSDSTNVQWTLPNAAGIHVMYVRVSDGNGGYSTARVRVSTAAEFLFSGVVADSDGLPVAGATVTLSNAVAMTETNGSFSLTVSNNSPAYVLTITKPGFAPISRVFTDESVGGAYTFQKPEIFTVPSSDNDISLIGSRGTALVIPAHSLTRSDGLPIVKPLTVAMTTIDPCNPLLESPVSTIAAGSGAGNSFLSSLTTAHIAVRDATGAELSLLMPTAATVSLPISSACDSNYPALPDSVGVWSYDLPTGTWSLTGTATLKPNPGGNGTVYQFTATLATLNNYNAADPTGPYSIINLTVDRTIALPCDVRVVGPSIAYTRTVFVTPMSFFFPPVTSVSFSVLNHKEAPGGYFADPVNPIGVATADTSKTVVLKVNTTSPTAYNTATLLLKLGLQVPLVSTKVEQAESFLTHNYGAGNAANAANYYAAVDPANQRTTLAAWKSLNGFNAGDEASAAYFNASDLGFGRRMHMRRKIGADSGTDTAFYVSNHDTADHAVTGYNLIATVAMEYAYDAAHPSHGRYTKFFVFDASDNRVDRANLDNNGDKYVPDLCMICHGGNHAVTGTPSTGWNLNAKFIPFDMDSYTYSTSLTYKPSAQHNAFRTMNLAIRDNTAPTSAIQALINGWYGIGGTGTFDKNFVPAAWQGGSDLPVYRDAVKISCRACHTTRPNDFTTPGTVGTCGYNVCNILAMPAAQRTFSILWGSKTANVGLTGTPPNQPAMLSSRYAVPNPPWWVPCP